VKKRTSIYKQDVFPGKKQNLWRKVAQVYYRTGVLSVTKARVCKHWNTHSKH